jgi:hypothetical protein
MLQLAAAEPVHVAVTTDNGGAQVGLSRNGQGAAGASADDCGICLSLVSAPALCLPGLPAAQ